MHSRCPRLYPRPMNWRIPRGDRSVSRGSGAVQRCALEALEDRGDRFPIDPEGWWISAEDLAEGDVNDVATDAAAAYALLSNWESVSAFRPGK